MQFVTREELAVIKNEVDGLEKLNEVLTRVYETAYEDILRAIPTVLGNVSKHMGAVQGIVRKFFEDNKEFRGHESLVQEFIGKIEGENPGLPYEEIVKLAKPEIESALIRLVKMPIEVSDKNPGKPDLGVL